MLLGTAGAEAGGGHDDDKEEASRVSGSESLESVMSEEIELEVTPPIRVFDKFSISRRSDEDDCTSVIVTLTGYQRETACIEFEKETLLELSDILGGNEPLIAEILAAWSLGLKSDIFSDNTFFKHEWVFMTILRTIRGLAHPDGTLEQILDADLRINWQEAISVFHVCARTARGRIEDDQSIVQLRQVILRCGRRGISKMRRDEFGPAAIGDVRTRPRLAPPRRAVTGVSTSFPSARYSHRSSHGTRRLHTATQSKHKSSTRRRK
jgi:hypothetical protein